jgi:uncharacterized protein YdaU (DUF1376 family)
MSKAPAAQFYFADYMRDTRTLSIQARGAWMDVLCIMWFSQEKGRCNADVTQMKRLWGVENDTAKAILDELITSKICDIETGCNGNVTLINRRMVRDEKERQSTKDRVKRFREKQCNADVTPLKRKCNTVSSSSSSNKKEIYIKKKVSETHKDIPPSIEDVTAYCKERNKGVDPQAWYDHYQAKGWMIGKSKMVNWQAAVRTWEKSNGTDPKKPKFGLSPDAAKRIEEIERENAAKSNRT